MSCLKGWRKGKGQMYVCTYMVLLNYVVHAVSVYMYAYKGYT